MKSTLFNFAINNFRNGIDDNTVYGYCSAAGTGEDKGNNKFFAYTKDIPDQQIICYC